MTDRIQTPLEPRKRPRQARSTDLVAAILEAAIRVLQQEGAARFTTARVADRAGISVGSLYQYFPSKAAILFRLQTDEWTRTAAAWRAILEDASEPPPARLRRLVHFFLRSECEEAAIRLALHDAAPLLRDAPDPADTNPPLDAFLREALPNAPADTRRRTADLIEWTLTELGERFSSTPRTDAEIEAYANAIADMLCVYVAELCRK